MHRVPNTRRFGAPEVLLIFAALAIIIPLTAWWHAFCQPEERSIAESRVETAGKFAGTKVPADANAFTIVGYYYPSEQPDGLAQLAAWNYGSAAPSSMDINLLLLFVVSVICVLVAILYSILVYPWLRAAPRDRWV